MTPKPVDDVVWCRADRGIRSVITWKASCTKCGAKFPEKAGTRKSMITKLEDAGWKVAKKSIYCPGCNNEKYRYVR